MLFALVMSVVAWAQPCPEVGSQTRLAWAQYEQAEFDAAQGFLDQADAAVRCQRGQIHAMALLELHWLRALVALSNDDAAEVNRALRASVATDHTQRPPVAYGPELRALWEQVAVQAAGQLISVVVDGAAPAWIDGRRVDPGAALQVARGSHVLQVQDGLAWSTEVIRLEASETIQTAARPIPADPPPAPVVRRRQRPPVLWVATAVLGAASAVAIGSGIKSERSFANSRYNAVAYDFCRYDQPCYPVVRDNAVRADAARVNAAYGVGYGLAAVTGGLLTVTIVGLPERRRGR